MHIATEMVLMCPYSPEFPYVQTIKYFDIKDTVKV